VATSIDTRQSDFSQMDVLATGRDSRQAVQSDHVATSLSTSASGISATSQSSWILRSLTNE
jgi:hypothetical protein